MWKPWKTIPTDNTTDEIKMLGLKAKIEALQDANKLLQEKYGSKYNEANFYKSERDYANTKFYELSESFYSLRLDYSAMVSTYEKIVASKKK